jgi:hypothetical protein
MMQQRIGFTPSPDRHHQGIGDESRCHSALIDQPTTRR